MNEEQIFRKIREQAKQYEEYDNFDREDLINELVEEKRINEANLDLINKQKEVLDKIKEYIKEELSQGGPSELKDLVDGEHILELLEEIE